MTQQADRITRILTLATAGFAVAALARPSLLSGHADSGGQSYYARMYAARAVPLAAGVLATMRSAHPSRELLTVAALAQAGDVLVGAARRSPGQVIAPAVGAIVYAWRALA